MALFRVLVQVLGFWVFLFPFLSGILGSFLGILLLHRELQVGGLILAPGPLLLVCCQIQTRFPVVLLWLMLGVLGFPLLLLLVQVLESVVVVSRCLL